MTVEIQIKWGQDRDNMVRALANSGYKVWVKEVNVFPNGMDYFVCFETEKYKPTPKGARK